MSSTNSSHAMPRRPHTAAPSVRRGGGGARLYPRLFIYGVVAHLFLAVAIASLAWSRQGEPARKSLYHAVFFLGALLLGHGALSYSYALEYRGYREPPEQTPEHGRADRGASSHFLPHVLHAVAYALLFCNSIYFMVFEETGTLVSITYLIGTLALLGTNLASLLAPHDAPHDDVRHRPSARWWIEVVAMGLLTYSYIVFALFGNTDVREDSRMYRAGNLLVGIMYVMKIVGQEAARADNHRGG
jgi:hypothetical protein